LPVCPHACLDLAALGVIALPWCNASEALQIVTLHVT